MGLLEQGNRTLACVPLIPVAILLARLLDNPLPIVNSWIQHILAGVPASDTGSPPPAVGSQLLAYMAVSVFGYILTSHLVPNIKQYTLKKGISGKDLGKRGTSIADKSIPEALGIVPGAVFLVCLIFCLVGYASSHPTKLLDLNSALLSICFMLFLGFTDDVLDWPWRYKLFLPSVASLPLLCCYNGSTSIVIPIQLRQLLWQDGQATILGHVLGYVIVIDSQADGALVSLGYLYLLYMGMLAVFCTNAINIYAGINGLEAGQSYVIGCAVLIHNLVEISAGRLEINHLFSVMIMLSFVGVTMGLLRHNWYPASVFVGDTYCYFAGMTFAVVGILGHFSKTLLLFFIPQVINFLWSTPQLFKLVPCPRHRLPAFNAETGKMVPSTFPCLAHEYKFLKRKPDDTVVPNMTVINLCLQIMGPMTERDLCVVLLAFQMVCCAFGFLCRYYLAHFFFES
jgi:UDP-N-acetylglucosamine--dolichyl-phosphate N-acetylglucosaminephosphotransferase